jgi:hypothetical protein
MIIPYTAISISVVSRFLFILLLYQNKSKKSLSLLISVLGLASSSMWVYYSLENNDTPMYIRSSLEIGLHSISSAYIIYNKIYFNKSESSVLPMQ